MYFGALEGVDTLGRSSLFGREVVTLGGLAGKVRAGK